MESSSSLVSVYPHVGRCGNVANMGEDDCAGGRRTDSVGIKIVSAFIQELRIECSFWNESKRKIPITLDPKPFY
jgi:hypothetical protein